MVKQPIYMNPSLWGLVLLYISVMIGLEYFGGDLKLAGYIYALEGNQWLLRKHWVTNDVLHDGGRWLNYIAVLLVLVITVFYSLKYKQYPAIAKAWQALTFSLILSFIAVSYLKSITDVDCPWSLNIFGGDRPYLSLFAHRPNSLPMAYCFPAGHASIGYAWVALFFMLRELKPSWRYYGLGIGLGFGLLFGFSQQLRGAHFLSHDVTTLFICLLTSHIIFRLIYPVQRTAQMSK